MSTMVERVARAIYEKRNGAGAIPWSRRDKSHKAPYLTDARAAIEIIQPLVERAFRDGIAYASNCTVTDIDEAWRTSSVRAEMMGEGQ